MEPVSIMDRLAGRQPVPTAQASPSVPAPPPAVGPDGLPADSRDFLDPTVVRRRIFDRGLAAARAIKPVANARFNLGLEEVDYEDPDDYSMAEQKQAILTGRTLGRRLRGTWVLRDPAGQELERRRATLATVPHMNQQGTFILNGNEYVLAHQMRLRPGVYTRVKESGEVESHVNVIPGKGFSHRYHLEPESGVFRVEFAQSSVPLLPMLRAMGVTDKEMRAAWGEELFAANVRKDDPRVVDKLYQRLVRKVNPQATAEDKARAVAETLGGFEFDPDVNRRTLGEPYTRLDKTTALAITGKLLKVARGEAEPDDRDHPANQRLIGPEDLISERLERTGQLMNQLLWRAGTKGSLKSLPVNAFDKHVRAAITDSGLGNPLEEVNALEVFDHQTRVTRLGTGGIPDADSVPDESRSVQPGQIGFVDPLRTPESLSVGIDSRLSFAARKGPDGSLYAPFTDARTGATVYRRPQDLIDAVQAFPGEMEGGGRLVRALHNGRVRYLPREKVDVVMPHTERWFSPVTNLVPLKNTIKGQRVAMGSRFSTQALSIHNGEAPLVRGQVPGMPGVSFEEHYGRHLGAVHADGPGRVEAVSADEIRVRYADGTVKSHQLYNYRPYNRKSFAHNTPAVKPGDPVTPGQLLARSNFTDDKGHVALGLNLRTAYTTLGGGNFEDAWVVSEGAAKKLTSDHMYQHGLEFDDTLRRGKKNYQAIFASRFDKQKMQAIDDDGVALPGTVVKEGDPLILAAAERASTHKTVHAAHKGSFADRSVVWEHTHPGTVTDVAKTDKGVVVTVRTLQPTQQGDKLCFGPGHRLLTRARGWTPVAEVTADDELWTLDPTTGEGGWARPTRLWAYDHDGPMYRLEAPAVAMHVTMDHRLWVGPAKSPYRPMTAAAFYAKGVAGRTRWRFSRSCRWRGESPAAVTAAGRRLTTGDWVDLAGRLLAAGRVVGETVRVCCRHRPVPTGPLTDLLDRLGFAHAVDADRGEVVVADAPLAAWLASCGDRDARRVPEDLQRLAPEYHRRLVDAMLAALGRKEDIYFDSETFAADVQLCCLKAGLPALIHSSAVASRPGVRRHRLRLNRACRGVQLFRTADWYRESVTRYVGPVYCVTVPTHLVYTELDGKTHWSMNSGRYGDKGVIARIVPDDEMPRDPKTGLPYELLANPHGVITRMNPGQALEAALGKVAAKTGKPYVVEDFADGRDMTDWVAGELEKNSLPGLYEEVEDPKTGRRTKVATGVRYFMKLHHQAESKASGRGLGSYTADDTPAKGTEGRSKKLAMMDVNALLSHGAYGVLRDARLIRGQKNQEYWSTFMSGYRPASPPVPLVYRKFVDQLRAAGVSVTRRGSKVHLGALTDRHVDDLAANRELTSADTVDWRDGLKPVPGGLFDVGLTGGHGGGKFASISLHEPMPNPVFEEPIRHLLRLTEKQFREVLTGTAKLGGKTGPAAVHDALKGINLAAEIEAARQSLHSSRRGERDDAVRRLGHLTSCERAGVHPSEWVLRRVPVLPPMFRPVSVMQTGNQLVSDANVLYKELFDANRNLKEMSGRVDDVAEERATLYDAFKGVVGLGDPVQPKNRERKVRGLLAQVFGKGGSKFSAVQQKLLGTTVDLVGRSTIVPNPDLSMDEVGVPENTAWEVYAPFVVRRLVRQGVSRSAALQGVADRDRLARKALVAEMDERPVLVNRAPVLHRFGMLAFYPRLTRGHVLQVSPMVVHGFNADFDGDAMNYQVVADDDAAKEAFAKMLPSHNLTAVSDFKSPVHSPRQEYAAGLWKLTASTSKEKRARVFATVRDAVQAYHRGELDPGDPVEVVGDK